MHHQMQLYTIRTMSQPIFTTYYLWEPYLEFLQDFITESLKYQVLVMMKPQVDFISGLCLSGLILHLCLNISQVLQEYQEEFLITLMLMLVEITLVVLDLLLVQQPQLFLLEWFMIYQQMEKAWVLHIEVFQLSSMVFTLVQMKVTVKQVQNEPQIPLRLSMLIL